MSYRVIITEQAEGDLFEYVEYIAVDSLEEAERWFDGATAQICSLAEMPERFARAPDSKFVGQELRHIVYRSHRIIFRIEVPAGIVRVITVRHAAQQFLGE